jgi:hypothetical protein
VGAWITTVDVNTSAGDSTKMTTTAVTIPSNGTLWIPVGVTMTVYGQGLYVAIGSGSNIKIHIEGTLQCNSNGTGQITYCPFLSSATVAGQTNTVEVCGNYSGGVCNGPGEDAVGYVTTPCPNYAHVYGDSTTFTGPKSWSVSAPSNGIPPMLWKLKCADFENMGLPYAGSQAFNVVDANGVKWFNATNFSFNEVSCRDVIHSIRHVDVRNTALPTGGFQFYLQTCTTAGTVLTQPQIIEFITFDNPEKMQVLFVGGRVPFVIRHINGGAQISLVQNSQNYRISKVMYDPYSTTIYGSWGWAGINTVYAGNIWENNIYAPYSTSAQAGWTSQGVNEDTTSSPPTTGGSPNIIRNTFTDGWGDTNGSNRNGHTDICNEYMFNNVNFNGSGRLASGSQQGSTGFLSQNYAHCPGNRGPVANAGLVANFNACDQTIQASVGAGGVPGCIALMNTYPYSPAIFTSDRADDISGDIFTREYVGVNQVGINSYLQPYLRGTYLTYDWNVYSAISGRSGNYKTPTGGNTYLSGPISCLIGSGQNCTTYGSAVSRTQTAAPGDPQQGPFHINAAAPTIQVGDVLCKGTYGSSNNPIPCGTISAIGSDSTCSTCAITVGGQSLWTTNGSLGVGTNIVQGDTLGLYAKYTADTNPDYGIANRGGRDIPLDPAYADNSCSLAKWDVSLGGPGSYANSAQSINANMAAMNGIDLSGNPTTFNRAYTVENALSYLRRCWTPTNLMLKNSVKDPARCAQAGLGDNTGQCDPGALPVSVGALLGMTQ